jgi:hypothetical protein
MWYAHAVKKPGCSVNSLPPTVPGIPAFAVFRDTKKTIVSQKAVKEDSEMNATGKFANIAPILLLAGALMAPGCAGGPLTTPEKGASIGALGGIGESKP